MIAPEVVRAFERWAVRCWRNMPFGTPIQPSECYPLYTGGRWYMRESMPGKRVWRLEDDFSFAEIRS